MEKTPWCIFSYKNRKKNIVATQQYPKDRPVYIFIWDFDFEESEYDKLTFSDNVTVIKVPLENRVRCIQEKRYYCWNYMKSLNIKRFWSVDDDMNGYFGDFYQKTYEGKTRKYNKVKKISLETFLQQLDELDKEHNQALFGFNLSFGGLQLAASKKIEWSSPLGCFYRVDLDKCEKLRIWIDKTSHIYEDMDLYLQLYTRGLENESIKSIKLCAYYKPGENTVLGANYNEYVYNTYKKWKSRIVISTFGSNANQTGYGCRIRRGKNIIPEKVKYLDRLDKAKSVEEFFSICDEYFEKSGKKNL